MSGQTYTPPGISSYGRVGEVTLSDEVLFGVKLAAAFVASVVGQPGNAPGGQEAVNQPPPGPGPGPTDVGGPGTSGGPPSGGVADTTPVSTGGGGSEGVSGSGGAGGGGGEGGEAAATGSAGGKELPFTGMAVALTAGVGVALVGAGARIRSLAGRQAGDDA